jgi:hypothetical protein
MTGIAATPVVVECNSAKYCILLKTKIVGDDENFLDVGQPMNNFI